METRFVIGPNANIGHPKLFMADQASAAESWSQAGVNNFVAARDRFGWPIGFMVRYPFLRFSRPGGSGLLTTSRLDDFLSAIASSEGG